MKIKLVPAEPVDFAARGVVLLDPDVAVDPAGPEWFVRAARTFRENVRSREYPCHFGRQSLERRELMVTHAELADLRPLADALAFFLDNTPRVRGGRHVLSAFLRPSASTLSTGVGGPSHDDHDRAFWEVLQYLHDHDPEPWPEGFPMDTEDPSWEFCFNGEAMFVFGAAPTHGLRASRNLADCLVLLFQPRSVFFGIEGGTAAGIVARKRIRERLRAWDLAGPHPSMGNYGDPSNVEWRQYFIPDDDSDLHGECPFKAA